jgi:AraC-like DNA-binding protein
MSIKKIRKTCIYRSGILGDSVRCLPMNHPQLSDLVKNQIYSAGIDCRMPNSRWGGDSGLTYLVFYVLEGELTHELEKVTAKSGDMLMVPFNDEKYFCTGDGGFKGVWFHLAVDFKFPKALNRVVVSTADHCELMACVMERLLSETVSVSPSSNNAVLHLSKLLTYYLFEKSNIATPKSDIEQKLSHLWLKVSSSLEYGWSVKKLSEEMSMSESNFHRKVMQVQQKKPMQIVQEFRMERAISLLKSTGLGLEVIAEKIGYSNAYTFSHTFTKYTGMRPGRFRRLNNK